MYTATGGTSSIPSPGIMETGENYLVRFKFSFGTTTVDVPYTIDAEDDTHWGFHRLEDVGEPVDGSDAATKNYVDEAIASLAGGTIKSNVLTWQTSGALTFAHWQFEGYSTPDYTAEDRRVFNISKINDQGVPVWTADDFVIGSEFRIQNVDNDDFLEGTITNVVDGGPASVQVTITRGASQGSAVGDQKMTVLVDGAEDEPEGQLPYVIDAEGDTHWFDKRLEDVGVPVAATDAATKGYVDSVTKTPTSIQYTLQYVTSSDSLMAGYFFWLSTVLMYRKATGDRIIPELKVGDECRLVKEDGTAIILEVTERLALTGGFFKFRVTNKTPGASIGNSEASDYFNVNFLYY